MKTYTCILLMLLVLGLVFALPDMARASGSGFGTPAVPTDPDIVRANQEQELGQRQRTAQQSRGTRSRERRDLQSIGFSERNRGNLAAAFKHYEQALVLDPKHCGAHEFIVEAHLMADNPAKAEGHMAALNKLSFFSCEEYRDLKAAIAKYKQQHPQQPVVSGDPRTGLLLEGARSVPLPGI